MLKYPVLQYIVQYGTHFVFHIYLRIVARDIGGSDPERMAAPKVEEYLHKAFKDSQVKVC